MTIAVDFDGVIHAYSRGWADGTIYDPPLPGALDGLRTLMDHDAVFIFTTRPAIDVAMWLENHGFSTCFGFDGTFWNDRGVLLVTDRKLAATAYLDDRAIRFTDWDQALAAVQDASAPHTSLASARTQHAVRKYSEALMRIEDVERERDEAYGERARLVALLAAMTDGAVIAPAPDEPGWQIVYLRIGGRQASWHISPRDANLFDHLEQVAADDPRARWDGHTTEEKYAGIAAHTAELAQRCGPACAEQHTETGRCEMARNR